LGGEETRPNPTGRCKSGSEIHPLVDRSCTPSVAHLSTYIRHGKCSLQDLVLLMVVERPDWKQHLCLGRNSYIVQRRRTHSPWSADRRPR
jgi:hypothetical protein